MERAKNYLPINCIEYQNANPNGKLSQTDNFIYNAIPMNRVLFVSQNNSNIFINKDHSHYIKVPYLSLWIPSSTSWSA